MSLASKIVTLVGTMTAYAVHYMDKGTTSIGVITIGYAHRKEI